MIRHLRHICDHVVAISIIGQRASYVAVFYSADQVAEIDRCPYCQSDLYEAMRLGQLSEVKPAAAAPSLN